MNSDWNHFQRALCCLWQLGRVGWSDVGRPNQKYVWDLTGAKYSCQPIPASSVLQSVFTINICPQLGAVLLWSGVLCWPTPNDTLHRRKAKLWKVSHAARAPGTSQDMSSVSHEITCLPKLSLGSCCFISPHLPRHSPHHLPA